MTDDQVRATLRQAVRDNMLCGWYRHIAIGPNGHEWVINPHDGPCVSYNAAGIRDYCAMLEATVG